MTNSITDCRMIDGLFPARVNSDNMEPRYQQGDVVFHDGAGFRGDGIYVLEQPGGAVSVKRVQKTADGVSLLNDGHYPPEHYGREWSDLFTVLGRVRACLRHED